MFRNRVAQPVEFVDIRSIAITMPEFIEIRK